MGSIPILAEFWPITLNTIEVNFNGLNFRPNFDVGTCEQGLTHAIMHAIEFSDPTV